MMGNATLSVRNLAQKLNIYSSKKRNKYLMKDRRNTMKSGTQDTAEGKMLQMKGKIKKIAGKVSMNRDLEAEGKKESRTGKVQ